MLQRTLPLAIAMGANFGGIATPVGTGPNGIALAAVEKHQPIGFLDWMSFGIPLAAGLVVAVATSLGVPFVITPPNAMAVAAGSRARDLLLPGLVLMVGGCLPVAVTGPPILRFTGIP